MDKRIRFETKERSNARREKEFLALTPSQRFQWFLASFEGRVSNEEPHRSKGNFIIRQRVQ